MSTDYPGRSEEQKTRLADRIVKDIVATLSSGEEPVSVAIEELKPGYDAFEPQRSVRT